MATPIKPTPILTGADSRRFAKAMENVKKISPEKREEQRKAYEWFKRAAQFPL
jgi:hypothetical protein